MRDRRACPASERCLAPDRASRALSFGPSKATTISRPASAKAATGPTSNSSVITYPSPLHEPAEHPPPGGHQLPADQPHPAAPGDALDGLVQQDRESAAGARVDRGVALVRRPRPQRCAAAVLW